MRKKNPFLLIRTRFAKDIVAEVMFPEKQTGKVAIIATGAPGGSSKKERMRFLTDQGYVALYPRYRGTWESDGWFLDQSPTQDIRDVIIDLQKKKRIQDVQSGKLYHLRVKEIHLFGWSFGGPAVLLNSQPKIVKKIIAVAPVIDWKCEGPDEPFWNYVDYSVRGFGGVYRTKHSKHWEKLIKTDFYNPIDHAKKIDGNKVFIVHAKDDTNVPVDPVIPFAGMIHASYYIKPKGGHRINWTHKFLWNKIERFLKKK